jgi:hypothetical protein
VVISVAGTFLVELIGRVRSFLRRILPMISLGAHLARRGVMAMIAIGIIVFTVIVFAIIGLAFAARAAANPASHAPVHDVPLVASSALVWGGGFLLVFSVAASALIRDRADGIVDLFVTRTTSIRGYIVARIGGLSALLAIVLGGGILLSGAVAIIAATKAHTAARTMQSTFAAFVYVLAFAVVLSPIAFAALGARRRISGYFVFLAILIFPEALASMLSGPVPPKSRSCSLCPPRSPLFDPHSRRIPRTDSDCFAHSSPSRSGLASRSSSFVVTFSFSPPRLLSSSRSQHCDDGSLLQRADGRSLRNPRTRAD